MSFREDSGGRTENLVAQVLADYLHQVTRLHCQECLHGLGREPPNKVNKGRRLAVYALCIKGGNERVHFWTSSSSFKLKSTFGGNMRLN